MCADCGFLPEAGKERKREGRWLVTPQEARSLLAVCQIRCHLELDPPKPRRKQNAKPPPFSGKCRLERKPASLDRCLRSAPAWPATLADRLLGTPGAASGGGPCDLPGRDRRAGRSFRSRPLLSRSAARGCRALGPPEADAGREPGGTSSHPL